MYLPVPDSSPKKWMNVEIKYVEHKWHDDFGEFYTYVIKNAEIVDIVDEEELVEDIKRSIKAWLDEGYSIDQLREEIAVTYGIPERYIDEILERVKVELGLVEVLGMLHEPE